MHQSSASEMVFRVAEMWCSRPRWSGRAELSNQIEIDRVRVTGIGLDLSSPEVTMSEKREPASSIDEKILVWSR